MYTYTCVHIHMHTYTLKCNQKCKGRKEKNSEPHRYLEASENLLRFWLQKALSVQVCPEDNRSHWRAFRRDLI